MSQCASHATLQNDTHVNTLYSLVTLRRNLVVGLTARGYVFPFSFLSGKHTAQNDIHHVPVLVPARRCLLTWKQNLALSADLPFFLCPQRAERRFQQFDKELAEARTDGLFFKSIHRPIYTRRPATLQEVDPQVWPRDSWILYTFSMGTSNDTRFCPPHDDICRSGAYCLHPCPLNAISLFLAQHMLPPHLHCPLIQYSGFSDWSSNSPLRSPQPRLSPT